VLFAIWAEPAEEYQQTHLGQVALRGRALSDYVEWRAQLSAGDQAAWDAFTDGLCPGPDLIQQLENFRLPDASASSPGVPTDGARRLIEALQAP
jgi:predicted secreted hydrolase